MRILLASLGLACAAAQAPSIAAQEWQHAGRLGKAQYIVVPAAHAREMGYYRRVIEQACADDGACFLRFFTNTHGAPVEVPLPDAIEREATVIFSRSDKRGAEDFRWSCRLQMPEGNCF